MAKKKGEKPKNFHMLEQHKFKPGESGNPAGRPKGSRGFKTVITEILDHFVSRAEIHEDDAAHIEFLESQLGRAVTRREMLAYKQYAQAVKGNTYAFTAIADREEGRPAQAVKVSSEDNYESFLDALPEDFTGEEK